MMSKMGRCAGSRGIFINSAKICEIRGGENIVGKNKIGSRGSVERRDVGYLVIQ